MGWSLDLIMIEVEEILKDSYAGYSIFYQHSDSSVTIKYYGVIEKNTMSQVVGLFPEHIRVEFIGIGGKNA